MECRLFHTEIAEGVFRISDALHGPNEDGFSDAPGQATQNSYLVVGEERAALIDLAVDTPELYPYACSIAGMPVQVLLTHGHPDHVYHLDTVSEVWLHPADHSLVKDGIPGLSAPMDVCLHPLADGQRIDLGGRELRVIALPGHTLGSVLFLDAQTGTLLSGDTCARRLLYGLTPTVPLEEHCRLLEQLNEPDFSVMYTAHDRCGLPKEYLKTILNCIRNELPKARETVTLPVVGPMRNLHWGVETTLSYFDMAIQEQYLPDHQTLQVTHLRVLHRENPIGIDETPDFSWMLSSRERNVTQQAYRILVRTGQETVWDSGYTLSDQQSFIPYEGKRLAERTRYFWQVTVWDCFGNAGCAEGFLKPLCWTAQAGGRGGLKVSWIVPQFPCRPFGR